ALVKWLSGDPLWHHLTALTVHYQTQPIPNPLSWWVHQAPVSFQKVSCFFVFVIEGAVPFLIFGPRLIRRCAFWTLAGFQGLSLATGNYAYFNWLTIVLCIPLLEDMDLRSWLPAWTLELLYSPMHPAWERIKTKGLWIFSLVVFYLTVVPFGRVVGIH